MTLRKRGVSLLLCFVATLCHSQVSSFQHLVVIFQENRSPDNLFQGLCSPPFGTSNSCSDTLIASTSKRKYNIQTSGWLDKRSPGGKIDPLTTTLAGPYGLGHSHPSFVSMCDFDSTLGACKMDGAANIPCGQCGNTTQPQFRYVDNSSGILNPYLTLATQYGFANYMFQTNQGASFSAHQYIFGATSAPTAEDDASGTFAAENPEPMLGLKGCIGDSDQTIQLIDAYGVEDPNNVIYPCFEHQTVVDLLDPINISWRYYAANTGGIWSAPDAIKHICQPSNGKCTGADFLNNVDPNPADVLRDVGNCQLRNLTWVTPTGQNSDHSLLNNGGGPSWVASIVNAIGTSSCKNSDGSSYWNSTAIIIAWDDWGGWYDHVPPPILAFPQGGYQFGFRVPMIVVSAYTPQGFIGDKREDFGSIVRFMEYNFGIAQGALNFADARADTNLKEYFNFHMTPRLFQKIPARRNAKYFLNDKSTMLPADDD